MSADEHSIARGAPANVGLDYGALVAEGTRLVQALSGKIWSNYNYSDPGVTILEQLCYTLTELSYRADFPVADLLGAPGSGRIAPGRQGLYPAHRILPINPLTPDDLRRVLLDQVDGLANIWFTPLAAGEAGGVAGLYRIDVLALPADCACPGPGPAQAGLVEQVLDCYGAHRALCEDVHAVTVLRELPTRVGADIHLADHSDPDTVMAALLFALGLCLSPEPQRSSLDALRADGWTSTEIFHGPLMRSGFIGAEQLAPLPRQMPVALLIEAMASVPGVLSVDAVQVKVACYAQPFTLDQTIPYPDGCLARLDEGADSLRLWDDGVRSLPDAARVRSLLGRLWAGQRRRYPLWPQYRALYRPPKGRGPDLAAYSSLQEQFPQVYGIGTYGLPPGAGPVRQAQARQLKGYLMPFDQLMADFFSQLAFVRELFSRDAGGRRTYAWQSLRGIVPNGEALLAPGYLPGLAALMRAHDPVQPRQNAVYDFLLSLYALELEPPTAQGGPRERVTQGQALLAAKRALLTRAAGATAARGRGIDYRRPASHENSAGMAIRCRIELGLRGAGTRLAPAADPAAITLGSRLPPHDSERIAAHFLPVEQRWDEGAGAPAVIPLHGAQVAPALLATLADPARYRVGALPGVGAVCLVCQDLDGHWWLLADVGDAAGAVALTGQLRRAAGGAEPPLFIVEWTLLRYASPRPADGAAFSFGISAVMPLEHADDGAEGQGWQRQACAVLRENTPAHIVVQPHFLPHRRMRRFLRLYAAWRAALRHHAAHRRAACSRHLAEFLGIPLDQIDAPPTVPPPGPAAAPSVAATVAPTVAAGAAPAAAIAGATPALAPPERAAAAVPARSTAAPSGARGAYVHGRLGADAAVAFADAGFAFVMRDLSRPSQAGGLLNAAELTFILQAGLALMAVQLPSAAGWTPDATLGARDGKRAAVQARCAALPAGATLWLCPPGPGQDGAQFQAYCRAWCAAVAETGYRTGLNVTAAADPANLAGLPFEQYWRGALCLAAPSASGFGLVGRSAAQAHLAGLAYEEQAVAADAFGATPYWCAPL